MSDRDIISWDKRLQDQADRGWNNYFRRRIYLDQIRNFDNLAIAGEFLYVEEVSSSTAFAVCRLNLNLNDPIDLELGAVVKTIFTNVIITNAAQAGEWIDIVWGINFEYYRQKQKKIEIDEPLSVDDNGGSLTVDGVVTVQEPLGVDDNGGSLTVDGAVTIQEPLSVDDNGGSLSVDDNGGSLTVDAIALPLPAGAATAANQLADGHNVTVDNAGGGAAVNIQDGGNTITVAGAVMIQEPLSVDDGGGSLTVDGSVAVSAVAGTVTTDDKDGNAQPCITITNVSADANTVGANHACKVVLIRAHTTNTGLVWIDINNAAVAGSCYPLDTGDAVSFRTTNTNLINALFKVANEKVTVIYQN